MRSVGIMNCESTASYRGDAQHLILAQSHESLLTRVLEQFCVVREKRHRVKTRLQR